MTALPQPGSTPPRVEVKVDSWSIPGKVFVIDCGQIIGGPGPDGPDLIVVCHGDQEQVVRDAVALWQERAGTMPLIDWLMAQMEVRP